MSSTTTILYPRPCDSYGGPGAFCQGKSCTLVAQSCITGSFPNSAVVPLASGGLFQFPLDGTQSSSAPTYTLGQCSNGQATLTTCQNIGPSGNSNCTTQSVPCNKILDKLFVGPVTIPTLNNGQPFVVQYSS